MRVATSVLLVGKKSLRVRGAGECKVRTDGSSGIRAKTGKKPNSLAKEPGRAIANLAKAQAIDAQFIKSRPREVQSV